MERTITEKEKEMIINFGAFEYSAEYCAGVLAWPVKDVDQAMKKQDSEFMLAYNAGRLRSEYVIDLKLFEQAQAGDIKSLEKLEMRKRKRK